MLRPESVAPDWEGSKNVCLRAWWRGLTFANGSMAHSARWGKNGEEGGLAYAAAQVRSLPPHVVIILGETASAVTIQCTPFRRR